MDKNKKNSDIFFVGEAKDRLRKLLDIYEIFTSNGLVCDFYITGVPNNLQKYSDKIHYNIRLSYEEVLQHIHRACGILEITQYGTCGLTMRFFESLIYDKVFFTDNKYLMNKKFGKYPKIFIIDHFKKFYFDKNKYIAATKLSNSYNGEYSPLHFVAWLESYFNQ